MTKYKFTLFAALYFLTVASLVHALPVPTGQQYFPYEPVNEPFLSDIPGTAKPIGVGPAAEGGDTIRLRVGLNSFSNPVDIYFGIHAPSISPSILILQPDGKTFRPVETDFTPWKRAVTGPIDEQILDDINVSQLPPGRYSFYLLASYPSGTLTSFFLWNTWIDIRGSAANLCTEWSRITGTLYDQFHYQIAPDNFMESDEVGMQFYVDCSKITSDGRYPIIGQDGSKGRLWGTIGECQIEGSIEVKNLTGYYRPSTANQKGYFHFIHEIINPMYLNCPNMPVNTGDEWYVGELEIAAEDGAAITMGTHRYRLHLVVEH